MDVTWRFLRARVKTPRGALEGPSVFYKPPAAISMHWTAPVLCLGSAKWIFHDGGDLCVCSSLRHSKHREFQPDHSHGTDAHSIAEHHPFLLRTQMKKRSLCLLMVLLLFTPHREKKKPASCFIISVQQRSVEWINHNTCFQRTRLK